tara:strand:- start:143 stop:640 length:498 start_codon:yes stop_codon:yes gene_type:complete
MPHNLIEFEGEYYPSFQAEGNAAQFILPFAKKLLSGRGFDIGCGRIEWSLPDSIPIDLHISPGYDAFNLPDIGKVDYIFSSHCLEHLPNFYEALQYWSSLLDEEGKLFLYLPHYSQRYWRPWNNKKHLHVLDPIVLVDYLKHLGYRYVSSTGVDLNSSFSIYAVK